MPEDTAHPVIRAPIAPLPPQPPDVTLQLVDLTPQQRAGTVCVRCGRALTGPHPERVWGIVHGGGRDLPLYGCPGGCPAGEPVIVREPGRCHRCGEHGSQLVVQWRGRTSGPDWRGLTHGDPHCAEERG